MTEDQHVIWLEFSLVLLLDWRFIKIVFLFSCKHDIRLLLPQYGWSGVTYFHFIPVFDKDGPQSCCYNSLIRKSGWNSLYDEWTKSILCSNSTHIFCLLIPTLMIISGLLFTN